MKKYSLVSVIVPVFNGEAFLADALDSIFAQRGADIEVVVIDDGSTDGSARIAQDSAHAVRYHRQENSGPAAARNVGLAMARGEFIAFLDADDLWPEQKLTRSLDVLQRSPRVDVVIGRSQFLRQCSHDPDNTAFEEVLAPRYYLQLGSAVFRRSVFGRVGPFDAGLRFSEDIDWFIRARELGAVIQAIDAISLLHRLHEDNITRRANPHTVNITQVLKSSLDRRRAASGKTTLDPVDLLFNVPAQPLEPK